MGREHSEHPIDAMWYSGGQDEVDRCCRHCHMVIQDLVDEDQPLYLSSLFHWFKLEMLEKAGNTGLPRVQRRIQLAVECCTPSSFLKSHLVWGSHSRYMLNHCLESDKWLLKKLSHSRQWFNTLIQWSVLGSVAYTVFNWSRLSATVELLTRYTTPGRDRQYSATVE